MRTLISDLGYALRQMRKAPGFTAIAVITLALGIGANTAIFTLVHAVLLQPLPVKNPSQLYRLGSHEVNCCVIGGLQDHWDDFSYALHQKIKQDTPEFEELAAFQAGLSNASTRRGGDNAPARPLTSEYVSGNYFAMFGVQPAMGRLLRSSDDQKGAPPAAVMSYRAWQNYFASDPTVVGSSLTINGVAFTVVGIGAPGFFGDRLTQTPPDFWLPLATEPLESPAQSLLDKPSFHWLYLIGRLKPGASPVQVEAKVNVELQQWLSSDEGSSTVGDSDRGRIAKQKVLMLPAAGGVNSMAAETQKGLRLLMALSGLVLVIACANIANLLLARGTARKLQTSVRLALGARRGRLVRQLLTESVSLAVVGGAVGLIVAYLGTRSILAIAFHGSPFIPINPEPSAPVLLFAFGLSLLTGIIFGVAPAWISSHGDPAEALRGAGRSTAHGGTLSQKVLVVLQAALSLVLVAGAILLVQSLRKLEHQNFGFQSDHRYIVRVERAFHDLSLEQRVGAYRELHQKMTSIPGVITSSYSLYSPLEGNNWSGPVYFPGRAHSEDDDYASWLRVGPDYFETLGTRLVRGRTVGEQDTPTSSKVAVVNQRFAKKFFGDKDPIGQRFSSGEPGNEELEIVGVVEDTKYQDTHGPAYATFFLPYLQQTVNRNKPEPGGDKGADRSQTISNIELHVKGSPEQLESTIRQRLAELDPDITMIRMTSFGEQVSEAFNQERLLARLTTLFGLLALTLAAIGLYGVTSYTVEQRTREIGIRIAVGANRQNVLAMVLGGAFRQVALGLVIGIPLALLAGWLISSQLFEVKGHDPMALALATLALVACALVAGLIPAKRAASIEPMQALRTE